MKEKQKVILKISEKRLRQKFSLFSLKIRQQSYSDGGIFQQCWKQHSQDQCKGWVYEMRINSQVIILEEVVPNI